MKIKIKIEDSLRKISYKKILLTESIYISADYAFIRRKNPLSSPDDGIICLDIY
jgi:hypothetical protein